MRPALRLLGLVLLWLVTAGQPSAQAQNGSGVTIEANDWLNVRFGPGLTYPRVGWIERGARYPALRRNPQSQWIEIAYPGVGGGRGWIFRDGVTISGDLNTIPVTDATRFDYPPLTATPAMVVTGVPVWQNTPIAPLNNRLELLSQAIYQYLLAKQFVPSTQKVGSVFIMDLQTGEQYNIHPGIAYSGMSLIKIPILVAVYRKIAAIPTYSQAEQIALMIACSENLSSNELLSFLGDGDISRGAAYVTQTMQALGLKNTFLGGALITEKAPTNPPSISLRTNADQTTTAPDPFNQTTPDDLGWLLAAIYQCANDGTGALPSAFPTQMTMQKCRGILRALRADNIPAMLRAGLPKGIQIAHKHGWIDEVHGDAGIVFAPSADYVLVIMLRNKTWLNYADSFPTIAEISRLTYNTFNPAETFAEIHTEPVPICDLGTVDPDLIPDLRAGTFPELR